MSSCAVSCCICSPRALFAFATSASLPTADAPRYCHYASQRLAQFHRRSNYKPPPPRNRTLFGVAPSVADRWRSSNDLPLLNSNFVLHRSWSPLHDIIRPQPQLLARFSALRRSVSPSPLDTFFMPQSRIASSATSPLPMRVGSSATDLDYPDNFYKPLSPHSMCIRPASAAPAASF